MHTVSASVWRPRSNCICKVVHLALDRPCAAHDVVDIERPQQSLRHSPVAVEILLQRVCRPFLGLPVLMSASASPSRTLNSRISRELQGAVHSLRHGVAPWDLVWRRRQLRSLICLGTCLFVLDRSLTMLLIHLRSTGVTLCFIFGDQPGRPASMRCLGCFMAFRH